MRAYPFWRTGTQYNLGHKTPPPPPAGNVNRDASILSPCKTQTKTRKYLQIFVCFLRFVAGYLRGFLGPNLSTKRALNLLPKILPNFQLLNPQHKRPVINVKNASQKVNLPHQHIHIFNYNYCVSTQINYS